VAENIWMLAYKDFQVLMTTRGIASNIIEDVFIVFVYLS